MTALTGHCLCGAISYSGEGDIAATVICHCDDCQRSSGSAFSVNVLVPEAGISIDGSPKIYETTGTETGLPRERVFCPDCGSAMFTRLKEYEGMIVIKAGTLDDRSLAQPGAEIWCESSQAWANAGAGERPGMPRGLPANA